MKRDDDPLITHDKPRPLMSHQKITHTFKIKPQNQVNQAGGGSDFDHANQNSIPIQSFSHVQMFLLQILQLPATRD